MKSPFCMKVCSKCGKLLVANNINFDRKKTGKYGLKSICKRCKKEQSAKHYQENKEMYTIKNTEYYQTHKKQRAEYYQTNREQRLLYKAEYAKNNPDIIFNNHQKRRQCKEFGPGISKEEWLDMMQFFNWKCAYSGEPLTKDNRSIDHVVPLKKHGWNGITNCVPCTRNVNSCKHTSDMIEWYKNQDYYSEDRLNKIYEWMEYSTNKFSKKF